MDIHQSYERVMRVMDEIQNLQENHITSFETELVPNIEKHCQERKNQFERFYLESGELIVQLEAAADSDMARQIVEKVNQRISGLLAQNDILAEKTREYRDRIQTSLNNLSRGKRVMESYGTPDYIRNRPRAIHLTN